ncbi:MAG TPA: Yip1 family protein [Chloroflexota bacterium]|nr:Yip1 family protein [Chloroflexota bacterium]
MALDTTSSSSIVNRMMRAARLEVPLYEEVEADLTATNQALLVVVIVAVASGIGGAVAGGIIGGLVRGLLTALIGWAVWSYALYFVGTRFFGGTATYGEMLRTLGFAQSPGVLYILGVIPVVGGIVAIVAFIWTLVTSFIATRQALDVDNTKTVFTILIAFVAFAIVYAILGALFVAVAVFVH